MDEELQCLTIPYRVAVSEVLGGIKANNFLKMKTETLEINLSILF